MSAPRFVLPDLCDAHEDIVRAAEPVFRSYGACPAIGGPIRTVKCFEDNSLVAERVKAPGNGAVLVVDGGGSTRRALAGGNIVQMAFDNGWSGMLVYGCIRDVDEIAAIDVGVFALGSQPLRSIKRGEGQQDLVVDFAGVRFVPDQYVYCDRNGVVVSPVDLLAS